VGPSLTWHEMNSAKSNHCLEHASKQLEFRITSRLSPHCCSNEINIAAVSGSTQSFFAKKCDKAANSVHEFDMSLFQLDCMAIRVYITMVCF